MRRYHPDRDGSASASAHARNVNAAYEVLSVPAKRARYDLERAGANVRPGRAFAPQRDRWLALFGAAALGIAAIAFLVPLPKPPLMYPEDSNARNGTGGPQLRTVELEAGDRVGADPTAFCSSFAVTPLLKRGLFRRAARLRGSDGATFDRLADASHIRFTSQVHASPGSGGTAISCSASVAIDLPPGTTVYLERRSVTGAIAYSLTPNIGSSGGSVTLGGTGSLAELLATVQSRLTESVDVGLGGTVASFDQMRSLGVPPGELAQATAPADTLGPARVDSQRVVAQASPSFSCRVPGSWAAAAVCKSGYLASLDRRLASLYGDAAERADASQRILLVRTDRRFLARRDACLSEACVQDAYAAQIAEIAEIEAARRPQR